MADELTDRRVRWHSQAGGGNRGPSVRCCFTTVCHQGKYYVFEWTTRWAAGGVGPLCCCVAEYWSLGGFYTPDLSGSWEFKVPCASSPGRGQKGRRAQA